MELIRPEDNVEALASDEAAIIAIAAASAANKLAAKREAINQ